MTRLSTLLVQMATTTKPLTIRTIRTTKTTKQKILKTIVKPHCNWLLPLSERYSWSCTYRQSHTNNILIITSLWSYWKRTHKKITLQFVIKITHRGLQLCRREKLLNRGCQDFLKYCFFFISLLFSVFLPGKQFAEKFEDTSSTLQISSGNSSGSCKNR